MKLRAARQLADLLAEKRLRLVLAESCTGGNVAGALATIPGVSAWLCGSFVIYRNESKAQWLGIPRELLDDPKVGPVSAQVTELLARSTLQATPEADVGVAITGHLGPSSPPGLDGRVFFALARRGAEEVAASSSELIAPAPRDAVDTAGREERIIECTTWVLREATRVLF